MTSPEPDHQITATYFFMQYLLIHLIRFRSKCLNLQFLQIIYKYSIRIMYKLGTCRSFSDRRRPGPEAPVSTPLPPPLPNSIGGGGGGKKLFWRNFCPFSYLKNVTLTFRCQLSTVIACSVDKNHVFFSRQNDTSWIFLLKQ